ncbi:MAG TPA: hypothetical protein VHV28_13910 [Solirubrobacteraceae bacterium]|jgi:hypothetical protein|nr:hypothetical protein [Solirubrobacteraceae bacterium]
MVDSDRQQRIINNEQQFKAFNEGLRASTAGAAPKLQVVCECGRLDCHDRLDVSDQEWRDVHEHPNRYVITVGHEIPDAERVVSSNDRYAVVQKNTVMAAAPAAARNREPGERP